MDPSTAKTSVPAGSVANLVAVAVRRGAARAALDRVAEVTPEMGADPEARVPLTQVFALWELIMRTLRDPDFPVEVAESVAPDSHHVLGWLARTSATLRQALDRVSRYLRLSTDDFDWELRDAPGGLWLVLRREPPTSLGRRCSDECVLVELWRMARLAAAADLVPLEVHLAHAPPAGATALGRFFRAPLRVDRPHAALLLAHADAGRVLPKADPGMHAYFTRHAEVLLARSPDAVSVADRVRRAILAHLTSQVATPLPSLDQVARALALSGRTLRRRLSDEGTTFEQISEGARLAVAERYLGGPRHSIQEVAYLLGYADVSAFHRAFRRWTGRTPQQFRLRGRGVGA